MEDEGQDEYMHCGGEGPRCIDCGGGGEGPGWIHCGGCNISVKLTCELVNWPTKFHPLHSTTTQSRVHYIRPGCNAPIQLANSMSANA